MEKYTKFRDRGSGIAPFFPVTVEAPTYFALQLLLFCVRLPLLVSVSTSYFLFLQWLPLGALVRKAILWLILGIPGIWWVDLQIDGVKRGSLGQNLSRLPHGNTIIAATFTSPLDALYIGAVFDAVFTISYPGISLVEQTSLLGAVYHAFAGPRLRPEPSARLVEVAQILASYPLRPVVVFPECTTTNGRGVLRLSPSVLSAPPSTKIFPVSLRYSAADITTPVPHSYGSFFWRLLSAPTHSLRVRIAEAVQTGLETSGSAEIDGEARKMIDIIGEHLARLGRVKYLGLGAVDKEEFLNVWQSKRR